MERPPVYSVTFHPQEDAQPKPGESFAHPDKALTVDGDVTFKRLVRQALRHCAMGKLLPGKTRFLYRADSAFVPELSAEFAGLVEVAITVRIIRKVKT